MLYVLYIHLLICTFSAILRLNSNTASVITGLASYLSTEEQLEQVCLYVRIMPEVNVTGRSGNTIWFIADPSMYYKTHSISNSPQIMRIERQIQLNVLIIIDQILLEAYRYKTGHAA